jgi:hypothetical protein
MAFECISRAVHVDLFGNFAPSKRDGCKCGLIVVIKSFGAIIALFLFFVGQEWLTFCTELFISCT